MAALTDTSVPPEVIEAIPPQSDYQASDTAEAPTARLAGAVIGATAKRLLFLAYVASNWDSIAKLRFEQ